MFLLGTVQMLAITEATLPDTGGTLYNGYVYKVTSNTTRDNRTNPGYNGLNVASNATVTIYIARGVTLTCYGGHASYATAGGAGIYVPSNSTLIITGEGTLVCYGGNAGAGSNGSKAGGAVLNIGGNYGYGGAGGNGGAGGGGAGAGIGGYGGNGAATNVGPSGNKRYCNGDDFDGNGNDGYSTKAGSNGATMGYVYAVGTVTVKAYAGAANSTAGSGGAVGNYANDSGSGWHNNYASGRGGGGAGGGSGYGASYGIGGGAPGAQCGATGGSGGTMKTGHGKEYVYVNAGGATAGGVGYSTGSKGTGTRTTNAYGKNGGSGGGQSGKYASAGGNGYFYAMTTVNKTNANRSATTITAAPNTIKSVVTFNMNATDAGSNFTGTYYYGIAMAKVKVPVRAGYYFKGYYSEATGGTQIFDKDGNAKTSYGLSFFTESTTTLYAQYEVKIQSNADGSEQLKQATPLTDKDVEYFLQHLPEDGSVKNKIDLSSATSIENPDKTVMNIRADKHFTKNTFIYMPAGTTFQNDELTENIIFKDGSGNISCPNLRVFDGEDMVIPQTFTAENARYDRMGSHRWGTICVPFALESNATVQFYTSGTVNENGILVLEKTPYIEAGQPAIYQIQDLEAQADKTDDIYLGAANAPIVMEATTAASDIILKGAFVSQEIEEEGVYYFSNNSFYLKTLGTPLTVPAFRAYIELKPEEAVLAPRHLRIADSEDPTAIYELELEAQDELEVTTGSYDLSGRQTTDQRQGVIIRGGRKTIK